MAWLLHPSSTDSWTHLFLLRSLAVMRAVVVLEVSQLAHSHSVVGFVFMDSLSRKFISFAPC